MNRILLCLTASLLIMGCEINNNDHEKAQNSGVFLDSVIEGLHYKTNTFEGDTDHNGIFHYLNCETITFSLGKTVFGSTTAKNEITPIDLVPNASDVNNPTVTNMIRFMQTMDSDGDPNNGIYFDSTVRNDNNNVHAFMFNVTTSDFESNTNLMNYIGIHTNTSSLMNIGAARQHFQNTLNGMGNGDMMTASCIN